MEFPRNSLYGADKFPPKRRSSRFFASILISVFVILAASGCEFFENSMADYFLDNTGVVEVTGIRAAAGAARPAVVRPDGIVLIPDKGIEPVTRLELVLSNPRNFTVRQELLGEGVPAGRDVSARQTGPELIELLIEGAEWGDEYVLVLTMQSPDGIRDFAPYTIRIKCEATKEITGFYFEIDGKKYGTGDGTEAGSGSIDSSAITVIVPGGTDLAHITPTVIHNGASYSPEGQQDFSSPVTYTVAAVDGTSQGYTVTVKVGIFITGFTNEELSALSFSGVPSALEAGSSSITITITGGVTVDDWYIDMTGPETLSPVPVSVPPDKVTFTVPILLSGFYNVNVIAKVGGVDYSGSFGLIVDME